MEGGRCVSRYVQKKKKRFGYLRREKSASYCQGCGDKKYMTNVRQQRSPAASLAVFSVFRQGINFSLYFFLFSPPICLSIWLCLCGCDFCEPDPPTGLFGRRSGASPVGRPSPHVPFTYSLLKIRDIVHVRECV